MLKLDYMAIYMSFLSERWQMAASLPQVYPVRMWYAKRWSSSVRIGAHPYVLELFRTYVYTLLDLIKPRRICQSRGRGERPVPVARFLTTCRYIT